MRASRGFTLCLTALLFPPQVLSNLCLQAQRLITPKGTPKLLQDALRRHNYNDNAATDSIGQRYMSVTVTWEELLVHIANDPDMEADDWALIFEVSLWVTSAADFDTQILFECPACASQMHVCGCPLTAPLSVFEGRYCAA